MINHDSTTSDGLVFVHPPQELLPILSPYYKLTSDMLLVLPEDEHFKLKKHTLIAYQDFLTEESYSHFFSQYIEDCSVFSGIIISIENTKQSEDDLASAIFSDWENVVTAKLKHIFLLTQLTINEYLSRGGDGKITFLVSKNHGGLQNVLMSSLYALCRSIAKEYGRKNIYCNMVDYKSSNSLNAETLEYLLFITSKRSSFITGEIIHV